MGLRPHRGAGSSVSAGRRSPWETIAPHAHSVPAGGQTHCYSHHRAREADAQRKALVESSPEYQQTSPQQKAVTEPSRTSQRPLGRGQFAHTPPSHCSPAHPTQGLISRKQPQSHSNASGNVTGREDPTYITNRAVKGTGPLVLKVGSVRPTERGTI